MRIPGIAHPRANPPHLTAYGPLQPVARSDSRA